MDQEISYQKTKVEEFKPKEELPLGVKIISFLFFSFGVNAVLGFLVSLPYFLLYSQGNISFYLPFVSEMGLVAFVSAAQGIFLWKKQNWARILLILCLPLLLVVYLIFIYSLFFSAGEDFPRNLWDIIAVVLFIAPLIIGVLTIFYLSFNKKVQLAFNPEGKFKIKDVLIVVGIFLGAIALLVFTTPPETFTSIK